jgi:ketosteroid isomerase-like protein
VRFNPGNPPAVGKQAIGAENQKVRVQYRGFKVLSYAASYKSIQVEDGMACDWGEHEAQYRLSSEAPPVSWRGDAFHVLRRQSDGSWKFAALIGNL